MSAVATGEVRPDAEVAVLPSHVAGQWVRGVADGTTPTIRDAVTGAPIARVSADGLDLVGAVAHAREVGGPGLRALTFTDRAAILRQLFTAVIAAKDDLYELSARAGATRDDAWFDVDGGIGAMASYASRGGRKLPDDRVWVDHDLVRVSRDDTFHAVQGLVPLPGVAVHVNAFNFPVWGMLEKLAPTLLAGVPAIVKPAPQAAFVAERAFRALLEADALPAGAIQLVCGGAVDLLDLLDHRDVVAFTGSSTTARLLRAHPAVVERNVRLNAETDSINAVVLGDVAPGSALEDDFVDEVVAECRAKAGQRCTAIRRVLVPTERLDDLTDRIATRFRSLRVGDPRRDDVDLGPLVDTTQAAAVRAAIERLSTVTTIVTGGTPPELVGVDPDPGTFIAPTLLRADDPTAALVHDVEAFGPVATVFGYRDAADAADLVARGGGGLVASVFAPPTTTTVDLVHAIAPHHGRVLVVDETSMDAQTGHGSPLPRLHHGGPGRAGGGSELGGLDGLHHYLQRVSIQGSPDLLTAVTGRWVSGATRHEGVHPFRKRFDELTVGDSVVAGPRMVSREDIDAFAELTGDHFYAHTDEEAAARNPLFGGIVAHGYFLLSAAAGLFVAPEEGPVLANTGLDSLRFMKPIRPGDEITVTLTCMAKAQRPGEDHGEVRWAAEVTDAEGDLAAVYQLLTMVSA